MNIREAEVADADQIAQVHVYSWQSAYKGLLPDAYLESLSVERRKENWQNAIENSPTLIDVCEVKTSEDVGQIVGFVAYGRGRDDDAHTNQLGEIYAIYLMADSWGNGYGKSLLKSALNRLGTEGYKGTILWVLDNNKRAIDFYQRNGFMADGEIKTDELSEGVMVTELRYHRPFTIKL